MSVPWWSSETASAHAVLGEAYRQLNDTASAKAEADRALALDPASVEAKQLLAMVVMTAVHDHCPATELLDEEIERGA